MPYLDRIGGTKILDEARDAMLKVLENPGLNPQSPSKMGSQSKDILETARTQVADLIGAESREITFVSNGTESVNLALQGLAGSASKSRSGRKIIVSAIEHPSVLNTAKALERKGFEIATVGVDRFGVVDDKAYSDLLDDETLLVSIQMANPEIGTIQNIKKLAELAHSKGALFHTDAVDAVGWTDVNVKDLDVDSLSLSGTQFHGPAGAAALYVRKGVSIVPVMSGGLQERHRRPGLENIPAIAALGVAAESARKELDHRIAHAEKCTELMTQGLKQIPELIFTGHPQQRIPGHVSVLVKYVEGEALLLLLDMKGVQAASGSSCTAKDLKISPVLMTLGTDHASAQGSLVFSTSHDTTEEDIQKLLEVLPEIVRRLRDMSPLWMKREGK